MKIGVVTIFDGRANYGNKLQNYAVVKMFQERNFDVNTLVVDRNETVFYQLWKIVIARLSNYYFYNRGQVHRFKYLATKFKFDKKYLHPNFDFLNGNNVTDDYDFFVIGSDQVWNPAWYTELKKEAFLLTFARSSQKICISPSFGVSELPEEWKSWFAENLQSFPKISVREDAGAKIIKDLTGKNATVLIDPTLMLDAKDWRELARKPKHVDFGKKYILTYFLGRQSDVAKEDIKKYCALYGLVEYNLQELNGHYPFASTPGEFIYMIENASLIMTDSFHCCIFSFLFSRPFLVYQRCSASGNMMSRIETLLDKFDLNRKYVESGLKNDVLECDYQNGYKKLKLEREKFNAFLDESLGR